MTKILKIHISWQIQNVGWQYTILLVSQQKKKRILNYYYQHYYQYKFLEEDYLLNMHIYPAIPQF